MQSDAWQVPIQSVSNASGALFSRAGMTDSPCGTSISEPGTVCQSTCLIILQCLMFHRGKGVVSMSSCLVFVWGTQGSWPFSGIAAEGSPPPALASAHDHPELKKWS